jgi:pimeloyl-ACP methyl ester carboxylesterase
LFVVPGLEHKQLRSFDGTRIAYQVRGRGPAVVLANGLGGSYLAFRHIYDLLGDRYRILSWHYRGLYDSEVPADPGALSMRDHCRDLEALLEAEGIERAVLVGWSMGVQLSFEYFSRRGEQVDGIVAINGTSGRPFDTVLSSYFMRHAIPIMLRAVKTQAQLLSRATRVAVAWRGAVPMLMRFGLVSRTLDLETFRDVASGFADLDLAVYTSLLEQLGEHDASQVLPRVKVPTLIITGNRDIMTPPITAERMHRALPRSRLVVIEGGTHYTPVEYPQVVCTELGAFLAALPGYGPGSTP